MSKVRCSLCNRIIEEKDLDYHVAKYHMEEFRKMVADDKAAKSNKKEAAMKNEKTVKVNGKKVVIEQLPEKTSTRVEFDAAAMDAAAVEAEKAFKKLPIETQKQMQMFWSIYYLKAGHKRLGRMLVRLAKTNK